MTYTITDISEKQLEVLIAATELYSRIGMGQFKAAVECYGDYDSEEVDPLIDKLTHEVGLGVGRYYGIYSQKIRDSFRVSWNIYEVLRHKLSWDRNPEGGIWVNFDKPMKICEEELLKVNKD